MKINIVYLLLMFNYDMTEHFLFFNNTIWKTPVVGENYFLSENSYNLIFQFYGELI